MCVYARVCLTGCVKDKINHPSDLVSKVSALQTSRKGSDRVRFSGQQCLCTTAAALSKLCQLDCSSVCVCLHVCV